MSGVAAAAQSNGEALVSALNAAGSPCEVMAYKSGLDQKLLQQQIDYGQASYDQLSAAIEADGNKAVDCIKTAKKSAAESYKKLAAMEKNEKIATDMKDVFIAWLSYFPIRVTEAQSSYEGSGESAESAAYGKAVSTLQVDEMTL